MKQSIGHMHILILLDEKSVNYQSVYESSLGDHVPNFMTIRTIAVETLH